MSTLSGLTVLVTRPTGQSDRLIRLIRAEQGRAIAFPTLGIRPLPRSTVPIGYDIAIVNSANAVSAGIDGDHPPAEIVIAMGPATQEALANIGVPSVAPSAPYHSESILAMAELQDVTNKKIAIISGAGGRNALHETLAERGASVDKIDVYERYCPTVNPNALAPFWAAIDKIILLYSVNSAENLWTLVPRDKHEQLAQIPMLVISQRVADSAPLEPVHTVIVANNATDDAILDTLKRWYTATL